MNRNHDTKEIILKHYGFLVKDEYEIPILQFYQKFKIIGFASELNMHFLLLKIFCLYFVIFV